MCVREVNLFADTIENNIKFDCPGASHKEVVEAAKKACCNDFIEAFPGYDTVIGEGGVSLSRGEKQRISIARVMLKDASIVILDEVTANVDPENEGRLQKAVEALARDKTILMIAYRLKTVRNVDQILVLDGGKIVQKGWHEELDRAARHLCGFCRREKGNRRLEAVIGERRKTVFAKKQRRSFWVLFSEQAFISVDFDGIQNAFLADAEVFRQLPDLGVAVVDNL